MVLAVSLFILFLYFVSSFQCQRDVCGFVYVLVALPWPSISFPGQTVQVPGMSAHSEGSDFQWHLNIPW